MEPMEMSLDDIIKAKKPVYPRKAAHTPAFKPKTSLHTVAKRAPIADARQKIIQKNRAKIRDVRDLISAKKKPKDARDVLNKQMTERLGKMKMRPAAHRAVDLYDAPYILDEEDLDLWDIPLKFNPGKGKPLHPRHFEPSLGPRRRQYVDYDAIVDTQPLDRHEAPSFDRLFEDYMVAKGGPVPLPPTSSSRYVTPAEDDVFDLYEAPSRDRRPLPPPPSNLRRYVPSDDTHLSYEMRSRLEGSTPAAPKSMGIFANPSKPLGGSSNSSAKGYRVMVTNLHSSVTVWDIRELFGDIGGLISAEIVKPGVAEVVYRTIKDAEDAVEVYHNRQLDGQPMKCHMITPPPAPPSSSSAASRKPPLELDLDTLHSALFTSRRH